MENTNTAKTLMNILLNCPSQKEALLKHLNQPNLTRSESKFVVEEMKDV